MIRIYSDGEKISYSLGDSFILNVGNSSGFEEGSQLRFQVAENEEGDMLIDGLYQLENGEFEISLSDEEKAKIPLGSYVYRIILLGADGSIVTQKSGELEVKWGA